MSTSIQTNPIEQVESLVQHVYGLRQSCTQKLSDSILQKVQTVRKTCTQAEAAEGTPQAWRRGGGNGGGSNSHSNGHGHSRQSHQGQGQGREQSFSSGAPQAWRRGGPSQNSNPPKQSSGGGQPYQPHARYVSKFTNSSVPVEKTILNKVILNKLNTFSAKNYDDVKAFLQQILDGDEKEFLQAFMSLVFEKATNEPTFCNLYAKMISELIDQYKSLSDELTRLYNEYLPIFDEPRTEITTNYDQLVQKNLEHVHRLGYSQFLSDLTRFSVLTFEQLQVLYMKIFEQIKLLAKEADSDKERLAEYAQCLWRMTESFQTNKQHKITIIRRKLLTVCEPLLQDILTNQKTHYPGMDGRTKAYLKNCLFILQEKVPAQSR